MPLPIIVTGYSGYKVNERPQRFLVDEDWFDIAAVEVRTLEPDAEYFRVRTTEGKRYLLRYDRHNDEWTLQSDFDGPELLARPGIEIITVDPTQVRQAESQIECCEKCHPDDAEIPFDWILAEVTGRSGMVDFLILETAHCPNCRQLPRPSTFTRFGVASSCPLR